MALLTLVVICEFYIIRIAIDETKADTPLIVDGDRGLSFPVPFQQVKSVAGRDSQIFQAGGQIYVFQLSRRASQNIRWKALRLSRCVQLVRVPVGKRLDHALIVICHVTLVNNHKIFTISYSGIP